MVQRVEESNQFIPRLQKGFGYLLIQVKVGDIGKDA
jgi:hypothetical protein